MNESDVDIWIIGNRFDVSGLACSDVPNMDEIEAIEKIRAEICQEETATHCTGNCMYGAEKCAYSMAIKALEEVQRYRAIGTLEERKEAIEKCKAKKPIPIDYTEFEEEVENAQFLRGAYWCPNCRNVVNSGAFCHHCGQKLDWSEEE